MIYFSLIDLIQHGVGNIKPTWPGNLLQTRPCVKLAASARQLYPAPSESILLPGGVNGTDPISPSLCPSRHDTESRLRSWVTSR